jgi:hypothetical protein
MRAVPGVEPSIGVRGKGNTFDEIIDSGLLVAARVFGEDCEFRVFDKIAVIRRTRRLWFTPKYYADLTIWAKKRSDSQ